MDRIYKVMTAATLCAALVVSGCSSNSKSDKSSSSVTSSSSSVGVNSDGDSIVDSLDNCPNVDNEDQLDTDFNGLGDACDPLPQTYTFADDDTETVSYTGQTLRHLLINDLAATVGSLTEDAGADVVSQLDFFMQGGDDSVVSLWSGAGDLAVEPSNDDGELTYGSVASSKSLVGKIAGGDGLGGGETSRLIDDEFFGWSTGLDSDPLPIELVNYYFQELSAQVTDGESPQISTTAGPVGLDVVYVDAYGRDYKQLIQKFLLMSVTFSQGTNDYLQSDFANELTVEDGDVYSVAEHHWDEGFGYFGASRSYSELTDQQVADGEVVDSDNSGSLDVRSEVNFGQSVNCAKRDLATASSSTPTDYSAGAFSAFLNGRAILRAATESGSLSSDAEVALQGYAQLASWNWEACIAATVVHYINDVIADIDAIDQDNQQYTDLDHFKDLAKHWSEMKGFALGLQFSPYSPFRASDTDKANLEMILSWMGDAPVLADGTQMGQAYTDGLNGYRAVLIQARDLMQAAYSFDEEHVTNW